MSDFTYEEINADNAQHTDLESAPTPDRETPEPERSGPESVRDTVVKSWNEHRDDKFVDKPKKPLGVERQRDSSGKFVKGAELATDKQPDKQVPQPKEAPAKPTKVDGPPQNWTDGSKQLWNSFSPEMQQALHQEWLKREEDSKAGFEKFKARYQAMEQESAIFAKELDGIMPSLQQLKVSPGAFIRDGIRWFRELSGPNRVAAAGTFLRSMGIDPQQVAGFAPSQPQQQATDPVVGKLFQTVQGMAQDLDSWKAFQQEQQKKRVLGGIDDIKDDPYFEQARVELGRRIGMGMYIKDDGIPDYKAGLEDVKWSVPAIRQALLQEQATKQAEEQQKAIAQQKQAGRSLPAARSPMPPSNKPKPNGKIPTARDDIRAAFEEVRARY